jgi:hypothetical protein
MQFGAYTFVETRRDPVTGEPVDVDKAFADVIEQIELADRVGLDVFGLGEHHRPDYAVSAPAVALAAAAARTKRIRLTSAVTVLSSDDPVRVYQQFATLDLISRGRAEIMAGRGSFIESFPLFGYDLNDYDELFAEKLDPLLQIRAEPVVTWKGRHRAPLKSQGVYPRALQQPLPVWIASGGTPQSVARAGALGLPLAIAIIGGEPARFAPLAELLPRGGPPRRRCARQAPGRHQWPWLPRRHGRSRRRCILCALRRGDEPDRPRARLAALVARAIRSGPRPARAFDGRHAGRGHRQNPRSARGFSPRPLSHADVGRRPAAGGDPPLDRASGHGGRAQSARGTGEAEGFRLKGRAIDRRVALRQRLSAGNEVRAPVRLPRAAGPTDAGLYEGAELPALTAGI